jgi:hypothetical protein
MGRLVGLTLFQVYLSSWIDHCSHQAKFDEHLKQRTIETLAAAKKQAEIISRLCKKFPQIATEERDSVKLILPDRFVFFSRFATKVLAWLSVN